jgi:hypothetical protein
LKICLKTNSRLFVIGQRAIFLAAERTLKDHESSNHYRHENNFLSRNLSRHTACERSIENFYLSPEIKFMNIFQANLKRFGLSAAFFLLFTLSGNAPQIFAHGGEDHGDAKPKTETTDKGTVSHSSRLGDLEVMLKHPVFAPDTATTARLFVTKFETNQGFADVVPAIEIESANNSVTEAKVEKTDTAGIFNVSFPALPQGTYTIRTKLTHGGETDTATFSGVEVKTASASASENSGMSWARTVLIGFIFTIVLALFGGLIYFVLRLGASEPLKDETVAA